MVPAMPRIMSYLLSALLLTATSGAWAQDSDSAYLARVQDTVDRYFRLHPGRRLVKKDRGFRAIPLYGVMYTQETGLMAMGGFMGNYRTSSDTLVPFSSVGAVAMVSTNLSVASALTGRAYLSEGRFVIDFLARYNYGSRYFWGIGFESGNDDSMRGILKSSRMRLRADLLYRGKRILAGGFVGYDFYDAVEFSDPELMAGNPLKTRYILAGGRFDYDSRDDAVSPSRGIFLNVEPSAGISAGGSAPFFRLEAVLDIFVPLWEGGVMAVDLYGNVSSVSAPWTVWPEAGGDVRLRGYYQGRYRDRNLLSAQVELRQRIYGSHGLALWGGAGNVFPSFSNLNVKNTLPTYGAGYRFTFLGIVLRLDAGFGLPGQWAIIAGVSHSF